MEIDYSNEPGIVEGNLTRSEIEALVARPMDERPNKKYFIAIGLSTTAMLIGAVSLAISFYYGVGMWGNNIPVAWGFPIVSFVFWIGIGHAGTLISAILFLLRQRWRNGIARFAEAMTIFAVMCAGLFPLIHMGRPWLAGYLIPYPNQHNLWVNFISPLVWDAFAVSTYFTISLLFWYTGLIPDLASLRDRTESKVKKYVYSILSLGWRHSARHWQHYEKAYLILAGLATPLVLSVHSVVSFDFAAAILPGWHSTIFPPYFVAGAIFSGFAMVMTVMVIVRKVFDLENIITMRVLENMNKVILLTASMVGYSYIMELFISWYSANPFEQFVTVNRALGPYAFWFWIMISCNVIFPQFFWSKKLRRSIPFMFIISILVNIGMWLERFIIIVTSLHRDYLPSSWGMFIPTIYDFGILLGSFGLFFTLILIFAKSMPVVSISEVKSSSDGAQPVHIHFAEETN